MMRSAVETSPTVLGMSGTSSSDAIRSEAAARWLPVVQFGFAVLWLAWGMAPPSVIPPAPADVEIFLPWLLAGAVFAGSVLAMVRGWSRSRLVAVGMVLVGTIFVFEYMFVM